jgi:hypothetical protein
MKISKKIVSIVLVVLTAVLLLGASLFGGIAIEKHLAIKRVNYDTYFKQGVVVQKIEDKYLIHLDTDRYTLIDCETTFADNTPIMICYEKNETKELADDRIVAISTDFSVPSLE